MRSYLPDLGIAIRLTVVIMVMTGILYPLAVTGVAQGLFPNRANGSLVQQDGRVIGSSLIGQSFTSDRYFHGRPSATTNEAGTALPYNAAQSSAANLGPTNPTLILAVEQNANAVRCQDGLPPGPPPVMMSSPTAAASATGSALSSQSHCAPLLKQVSQVPVDAVTSSGSGLDPDVSVAYANLQVARVARARNLPEQEVQQVVNEKTLGRQFRILGERRVNVLDLNRTLDALSAGK